MKLSRTYQVSFCQITPLKIRGERGVMSTKSTRACLGNPLYPPYCKGDIEGETPCVLEGDVEGVARKRSSL